MFDNASSRGWKRIIAFCATFQVRLLLTPRFITHIRYNSGGYFDFSIETNLDAGNRTINYNKFEPVNRIFSHVDFNISNPGNDSKLI